MNNDFNNEGNNNVNLNQNNFNNNQPLGQTPVSPMPNVNPVSDNQPVSPAPVPPIPNVNPVNNGIQPSAFDLNQAMPVNIPRENKFKEMFKKIKPAYLACFAVVVVLLVGGIILLSSSNYNKVVKNYCTAMDKMDADIYKTLFPSEFFKDDEYDEIAKELNESKEQFEKLGAKMSVNCTTLEKTKLDKDELKTFNNMFQEQYATKRKISKAYDVKVKINTKLTIDGEDKSEDEEHVLTVGKISGKWYLLDLY